jgi:hypothetical protein
MKEKGKQNFTENYSFQQRLHNIYKRNNARLQTLESVASIVNGQTTDSKCHGLLQQMFGHVQFRVNLDAAIFSVESEVLELAKNIAVLFSFFEPGFLGLSLFPVVTTVDNGPQSVALVGCFFLDGLVKLASTESEKVYLEEARGPFFVASSNSRAEISTEFLFKFGSSLCAKFVVALLQKHAIRSESGVCGRKDIDQFGGQL